MIKTLEPSRPFLAPDKKNKHTFFITGGLDDRNLQAWFIALCTCIDTHAPCPELVFDLSRVSHAGSGGLALLLSVVRHAFKKSQKIIWTNPPATLQAAARISNLDKILPWTLKN